MSKYQEAIKELFDFVHSELDGTRMLNVYIDYIETLKELVDKATPKKTIKEPIVRDGYRKNRHYCPICKQDLLILGNYCLHCGQAVDWS